MDYQIINYIFSEALLSCPIMFEIFALLGVICAIWLSLKLVKKTLVLLWGACKWCAEYPGATVGTAVIVLMVAGFVVLIVFLSFQERPANVGDYVLLKDLNMLGTVIHKSDLDNDEYTKYTIRCIVEENGTRKEVCGEYKRDEFIKRRANR